MSNEEMDFDSASSSSSESSDIPQFEEGTRLMISKMVMENFKSYAGVQEVGPFHKCFSSVVGPNGSGKSNLIDAMLFVFGKRASKIRLKKVSELIHKSENHRDFEFARVSVHFQMIVDQDSEEDDNAYEVVEGSEFVISRTAYLNNSSKYSINGKTSNFKEVTTQLKQWGIDLDNNRFLILQGEVEQISLMKPLELLAYLEDIIGSNKLVEKINELGTQVEAMNEERASKLHRVKVIEKDRDALEGAKLEAERFQQQEQAIETKRSIVYQLHEQSTDEALVLLKEQLATRETSFNSVKSSITEKESQVAQIEKEYNEQKQEVDLIQKELAKIEKDFKQFECNDIKLRTDSEHCKKRIKKLKTAIKAQQKKISQQETNRDNSQVDITALEKDIAKTAKTLEKEEAKLAELTEELKEETADLQASVEEHQQELKPFVAAYDEIKNVIDVAQAEHDLLVQKIEGPQKEYDQLQVDLKQTSRDLEAKHELLASLEASEEKMAGQLESAKESLKSVSAEEEQASQNAKSIMTSLQVTKQALEAQNSRSQLLKALMKAQSKKNSSLSGICGRLGDLGSIDGKYDVAVSTACPALDHIVVETTSEAQECVNYLKKHQLGTACFIILEKLEYIRQHLARDVKVPKGADRLFDLIEFDEDRFDVAFYYALKDTLVADKLNQAVKISSGNKKQRWRVVTLAGEVIDASGAMTGGGNKVSRGSLRIQGSSSSRGKNVDDQVTEEDVVTLQHSYDASKQEMEQLRKEKSDLETQVEQISRRLSKQLPIEFSKVRLDIEALQTRQSDMESRLTELESHLSDWSEDDKDRLDELAKQITKDSKKLATAQKKVDKVQAVISQLQQEIKDFSGVKLKAQKYKVESAQQKIDEFESAITKANVTISQAAKNIEKAEKQIETQQKEIEEETGKIKQIEEQLNAMTDEALQVQELHEEAKQRQEGKTELLDELRKAFKEAEKELNEMRSQEVDAVNQLDDVQRVIREQESKLAHWRSKLGEMEKASEEAAAMAAAAKLNASASSNASNDDMEQEEEQAVEEETSAGWFKRFNAEELAEFDREALMAEITQAEDDLLAMHPNMAAIEEYRLKDEEFKRRTVQLDEVTAQRDVVRKDYDNLRKDRLNQFMAGFSTITMKLKEMYQMITLGGDAELELVDSLDPFAEGIVFSVRPPKKSWKNISNLSGGEKTLSSLSLVFALHHYKPTPLYVMDEIDAALDFKNVSIVAHYIKERTKNAQFVIISLRNNMFELADRLVGIYKTDNSTKSVTINPNKMTVPLQSSN